MIAYGKKASIDLSRRKRSLIIHRGKKAYVTVQVKEKRKAARSAGKRRKQGAGRTEHRDVCRMPHAFYTREGQKSDIRGMKNCDIR